MLEAICQRFASPEGKAHVRKSISGIVDNRASDLAAGIAECRERIAKTEAEVKEMLGLIKRGEHSATVGASSIIDSPSRH